MSYSPEAVYIRANGALFKLYAPDIHVLVRLVNILYRLSQQMLMRSRTSQGNVHWISPTLAGIPFGYSMLAIVGHKDHDYNNFTDIYLYKVLLFHRIVR